MTPLAGSMVTPAGRPVADQPMTSPSGSVAVANIVTATPCSELRSGIAATSETGSPRR